MPAAIPAEIRHRAVRLVLEARSDPVTARGAVPRVAKQLGLVPDTLGKWVRMVEADMGVRSARASADAARIKELEREVKELRRANEILKSSAAFFAAEFDRQSR